MKDEDDDPLPEWAKPAEGEEGEGGVPVPGNRGREDRIQRVFREISERIEAEDADLVLARQPIERLECFKRGAKRALDDLEAKKKEWESRGNGYSAWGRTFGLIGGLFFGLSYKMTAARGIAYEIVEKFYETGYGDGVGFHPVAAREIGRIADEATRIPPGIIGLAVGALIGAYAVAIPYFMLTQDRERGNRIKRLRVLYSSSEKAIEKSLE